MSSFMASAISGRLLGDFNPFTAMHAVPSLGKRPIKLPNLRSLRLFFFSFLFSASHEQAKGLISYCTELTVDLLQDYQTYYLQACMCALFSPDILQAGAMKGIQSGFFFFFLSIFFFFFSFLFFYYRKSEYQLVVSLPLLLLLILFSCLLLLLLFWAVSLFIDFLLLISRGLPFFPYKSCLC